MPGVESFDVQDDKHWRGEREDPARPRRPEDDDGHGEDRGARARVRAALDQGQRRRRDAQHDHGVHAQPRTGGGTKMDWEADVHIAGPVGSMGQRVLQPIVNQQVEHVLTALDEQVREAPATAAES